MRYTSFILHLGNTDKWIPSMENKDCSELPLITRQVFSDRWHLVYLSPEEHDTRSEMLSVPLFRPHEN